MPGWRVREVSKLPRTTQVIDLAPPSAAGVGARPNMTFWPDIPWQSKKPSRWDDAT